jgi:hypothetical protein
VPAGKWTAVFPIVSAITLVSVFASLTPGAAPIRAHRPAHIILIRHAEKPADPANPHLSAEGVKRAQLLVTFITTDPAMTALGRPVAIFATKTTKDDDGQRTQETVAPLAKALKLPVQTPFLGKDYKALVDKILGDPAYDGKTVLICWNHEEIPQLTGALGVKNPAKWRDKVFDVVYVISFHGKKTTLTTSRY